MFRLKLRTIIAVVLSLTVISIIVSEIGAYHFPSANYYLLPSRAWQILAGALCAFLYLLKPPKQNDFLALLGLILIFGSILTFDMATRIPSTVALIPVCGTAMVLLFATTNSRTGRFLSWTPLVWIGRISFSLYLIHQPLFAFWRIRGLGEPSTPVMVAMVALTIVLGALNWWLVEQRFRYGVPRLRSALVFSALFLAAFGGLGIARDGLPFRLSGDLLAFTKSVNWNKNCLLQVPDEPEVPVEKCIFNAGGEKIYAVWGDSIGSSITPALVDRMREQGNGVIQMTHGHCAPILGLSYSRNDGAVNCDTFNMRAMDYLKSSNVDTVILAASWVNFFNASHFSVDGKELPQNAMEPSLIAQKVEKTILELKKAGKQVVVVFPTPNLKTEVLGKMSALIVKGDTTPSYEYALAEFQKGTSRADSILQSLLPADVAVVDPEEIFCDPVAKQSCFLGRDGVAFIADKRHYTYQGASMIVAGIEKAMVALDGKAQ